MSSILDFLRKYVENTLELKRNYKAVFDLKSPAARIVLADLREFGGPDLLEGCGAPVDPIALGVKIGREQVVKRIFEMMNITETDINNAIIRGERNGTDEY